MQEEEEKLLRRVASSSRVEVEEAYMQKRRLKLSEFPGGTLYFKNCPPMEFDETQQAAWGFVCSKVLSHSSDRFSTFIKESLQEALPEEEKVFESNELRRQQFFRLAPFTIRE